MFKKIINFYPIAILLTALVLFYPFISLSNYTFIHSGLVMSDLYTFNYPVQHMLYEGVQQRRMPFWTNQIGNGYPIFAEGQMGMLYPPHLIAYLLPLPFNALFKWLILGHILLAGIGTYLYCTRGIKLSKPAGIFVAIVFMFCGYMTSYVEHVNVLRTAAYFPLNLLFTETLISQTRITRKHFLMVSFLGSILLSFQLLSGHIETAYYNILFTVCYVLIRIILDKKVHADIYKKIISGLLIALVSGLIIAPQLASTAELIKYTQRESGLNLEQASELSWPFETVLLFINPRIYPYFSNNLWYTLPSGQTTNIQDVYPYLGLLPLVLIIFAIAGIRDKQSISKNFTLVFLIFTALTYLYAIGNSTQLFIIIRNSVPGLNFFRFPYKTLYIIELALCILSGIGFDQLTVSSSLNKNRQRYTVVTATLIIIAFINLRVYNQPLQPATNMDEWLKEPASAEFINSKSGNSNDWRVYSNQVDLAKGNAILSVSIKKAMQSLLSTNYNALFNIPQSKMYAALYLNTYSHNNQYINSLGADSKTLLLNPEMKKQLQLQSVKYYLSTIPLTDNEYTEVFTANLPEKIPQQLRTANATEERLYDATKIHVYENKNFRPRFMVFPLSKAITVGDSSQALSALQKQEFNPLEQIIIEDFDKNVGKVNSKSSTKDVTSQITNMHELSGEIEMQVSTNNEAILSINDTNYPGWHATINGKQTQLYRANYAFNTLIVPPGTNKIKLWFEPTWWKYSLITSLIGVGITLISFTLYIIALIKAHYFTETLVEVEES